MKEMENVRGPSRTRESKIKQNWMLQGWHYGEVRTYYTPIFWLTKLTFLWARAIPRENIFKRLLKFEFQIHISG